MSEGAQSFSRNFAIGLDEQAVLLFEGYCDVKTDSLDIEMLFILQQNNLRRMVQLKVILDKLYMCIVRLIGMKNQF